MSWILTRIGEVRFAEPAHNVSISSCGQSLVAGDSWTNIDEAYFTDNPYTVRAWLAGDPIANCIDFYICPAMTPADEAEEAGSRG